MGYTSMRQYRRMLVSQEIPQVQVVERIQEPNVEPFEVLLHERVQQFTTEQSEHMPVSQTQEQSAVTDAVEVVDSLSCLGRGCYTY